MVRGNIIPPLIVFVVLFSGCLQGDKVVEFQCPDGSYVSDIYSCPKSTSTSSIRSSTSSTSSTSSSSIGDYCDPNNCGLQDGVCMDNVCVQTTSLLIESSSSSTTLPKAVFNRAAAAKVVYEEFGGKISLDDLLSCLRNDSSKCLYQRSGSYLRYLIALIPGYGNVYIKLDQARYPEIAFDPQLYDEYFHHETARECTLTVWQNFGFDWTPKKVYDLLDPLTGNLGSIYSKGFDVARFPHPTGGEYNVVTTESGEVIFDPQECGYTPKRI
ncbi:MAG: hypothetical protein ABH851_02440 [Methanobacteriota archaeon]